jgi:hypothetical protein
MFADDQYETGFPVRSSDEFLINIDQKEIEKRGMKKINDMYMLIPVCISNHWILIFANLLCIRLSGARTYGLK